MWHNIVWSDVKEDNSILLIEHPIYDFLIEKDEYFKEFSDVLEQLNGDTMSDYMDFFFTKDFYCFNISNFNIICCSTNRS